MDDQECGRYLTPQAYLLFKATTRATPFMDAMVVLDLDSWFLNLFMN